MRSNLLKAHYHRSLQLSDAILAFASSQRRPLLQFRKKTVLLWSSISNDGRTFENYIGFLRKSFFFLDKPVTWFSPAVVNVSRGLRAAGKGRFRFPNFIRSELVIRVVNLEPLHIQFAQLAFCAYLFCATGTVGSSHSPTRLRKRSSRARRTPARKGLIAAREVDRKHFSI